MATVDYTFTINEPAAIEITSWGNQHTSNAHFFSTSPNTTGTWFSCQMCGEHTPEVGRLVCGECMEVFKFARQLLMERMAQDLKKMADEAEPG